MIATFTRIILNNFYHHVYFFYFVLHDLPPPPPPHDGCGGVGVVQLENYRWDTHEYILHTSMHPYAYRIHRINTEYISK